MQTQHTGTRCQVHIIPGRAISPDRIFEVRRLAKLTGCDFIPRINRTFTNGPTTTGPWDGGSAA